MAKLRLLALIAALACRHEPAKPACVVREFTTEDKPTSAVILEQYKGMTLDGHAWVLTKFPEHKWWYSEWPGPVWFEGTRKIIEWCWE